MRYFLSLVLFCCVVSAYVLFHAGNAGASNHAIPQTDASRSAPDADGPILIKVDTTMIEKLPIAAEVIGKIRQLPYVSKDSHASDWHIRIRPDTNKSRVVVEREGGSIVATMPLNDPNLVAKVSSRLEMEARWRIIRSLENSSQNSTIRVEMRVVPVEVGVASFGSRVRDVKHPRKRPEGQLLEGDQFVFEIRNNGTTDAYVSIVDLVPDGSMHLLFPNPAVPAIAEIAPDGKWHRISRQVFRIIAPFGLEVFKVIATKQRIDSKAFDMRDPTDAKASSTAFRSLFGKLLEGERISAAKLFGTSDWGTAALTFEISPRRKANMVAVSETDAPKTTLHILAIGINQYKNPESHQLALAAKDAQDFAAALERVGRSRFGKINTRLILDTGATKASISATFNRMIAEAKPQDTFVFFYSGLSRITDSSGPAQPQLILLPTDFKMSDPPNETANGISAALLQTWFTKIESRHQLIVLDTCRSESGFETFVSRIASENEALGGLLQRDMVILGTAGLSYEDLRKGNGSLTYTLLKGLTAGVDAGNEITARRLLSYARQIAATESRELINFKIAGYEVGADFPLGSGLTKQLSPGGAQKHHHNIQEPSPKRAEPVGATAPKQSRIITRTGKDYALLIAINNYDHWSGLRNPITDAQAIADELKNYYGFETEVLEDPTKTDIFKALSKYKYDKKYADDDQLFIFFAGHGSFNEEFKEGYFIAKDSKLNDEYGDSYLSYSNLRNVIDYIPCKHIFLVLDACFGGTFDERVARRGSDPEYEDAANPEFISDKMRFKTRQFITSGDKVYVSDGRPGQHSPFSRKLLEALRDYGGKYGILTITRIRSYVERVLPRPHHGDWGTDEPGSEFIFIVRKRETQ